MRYLVLAIVLALAVTQATREVAAQTTFTVTGVCCDHYDIDGQRNPTLTVVRGQTYQFNLINAAFHPFGIQSTAGIGGTLYPNVTNNGGTSGTVTLTVPLDETAGTLFYQCGNHVAMNGVINVVDPTPGSSPTLTPTPSQTATPTLTQTPTPTPILGPCVGDCDDSLTVTVDELAVGVNILLGTELLTACPQFDSDDSGTVTVDELVKAVSNLLGGCSRS